MILEKEVLVLREQPHKLLKEKNWETIRAEQKARMVAGLQLLKDQRNRYAK